MAAGIVAVSLGGCDLGSPELEPSRGPSLHLLATEPADGAGIDCAPGESVCGVPIDTPLELRFDRFLLPRTAIRQSIVYFTGLAKNPIVVDPRLPEMTPTYDPLERVVRFTLPSGATLRSNTLYSVLFPVAGAPTLPSPETAVVDWGFRAIDGAPLAEGGLRSISFRTGSERGALPSPEPPPDCAAIVGIFRCEGLGCPRGDLGCASCHDGGPSSPLRLALGDEDALSRTAIGHVAHETEVGPTTGVALQDPARFGASMPIIDPRRPDNSYLVYKLLAGHGAYRAPGSASDACESSYSVNNPEGTPGEDCLLPSEAELSRLRERVVLGEPMPPAGAPDFIHADEVRRIARWIQAGAVCP